MDQEVHNCKKISAKSPSFFFQEGLTDYGKKILILGESLAKNGWVESGKAFYTKENKLVPTGKKLNEELSLLNIRLEECAFTEIAKCYIGKNRKQLSVCGLLCSKHFFKQLDHFEPKIIISLGVITKDILGEIFKTTLPLGKIKEVTYKSKTYAILPIYHPSPANPFGHAKNIKIISEQKKTLNSLIN